MLHLQGLGGLKPLTAPALRPRVEKARGPARGATPLGSC